MTSFFGRLFGIKPSQQDALFVDEVRAKALLTFLIPQLQLLDLELEQVPASGSYVSKRSRGYVYGMAGAILAETSREMTNETIEDIMQAAFTLVWGRDSAQSIFEATLAECAARDGETVAGSYRAEADVGEVYAGKPHSAVVGFWLLNNGLNDPEELMPPIINPSSAASMTSPSLSLSTPRSPSPTPVAPCIPSQLAEITDTAHPVAARLRPASASCRPVPGTSPPARSPGSPGSRQ